jgi:hypothetical protein
VIRPRAAAPTVGRMPEFLAETYTPRGAAAPGAAGVRCTARTDGASRSGLASTGDSTGREVTNGYT